MKKYVIASIVLCLVAMIGVVIYFAVPKRANDPTLVIDAENIEVCVGESAQINYVCSIKSARMSFKIENESIATTMIGESGVEVFGVAQGTTKLTLIATYNAKECEKTIEIVVKPKATQSNPPADGGEGENPSGGETPPNENGGSQNPNGDQEGESGNPEEDNDTKPELIFPQTNLINCRIEEEKLIVEVSTKAMFTISASATFSSIEIENENPHISIAEDLLLGNNTYSILASQSGEFEIKIILDGKHEYIVVVKAI